VSASPEADVIVCDVAPAYPSELGLKKFIRTFRFQKPDRLEVADELEAGRPVMFESRYQVNGNLEKLSETEFRLTQAAAGALLSIAEAPQSSISLRDSALGLCLCLATKRKQLKARFTLVIRVEEGP
jgi:hypothetical protein